MGPITLLAIADPAAPHLRMLRELPASVRTVVSDDLEKLKAAAPEADVLLNGGFHGPLFRAVFPFAAKVRWVHNLSAGVEGVLTPELVASPVPLTNGRGVFSNILGEFVIGAVLYFAKDFRRMIRNQEAGEWAQFDVTEVKGQVMGIVGYGDIGQACARLAHAIGMRVMALRRRAALSQNDPNIERIYTPERLDEMLCACDYLVAATPNTPETRGLIGERQLGLLKPEAVIINVGRGPVIVEEALIAALAEKRIKGAALDVFDKEPLREGHPFYRLKNVLLSPHCADHTPGWTEKAMQKFLDNFERFWKGEPLEYVVDKRAGY